MSDNIGWINFVISISRNSNFQFKLTTKSFQNLLHEGFVNKEKYHLPSSVKKVTLCLEMKFESLSNTQSEITQTKGTNSLPLRFSYKKKEKETNPVFFFFFLSSRLCHLLEYRRKKTQEKKKRQREKTSKALSRINPREKQSQNIDKEKIAGNISVTASVEQKGGFVRISSGYRVTRRGVKRTKKITEKTSSLIFILASDSQRQI